MIPIRTRKTGVWKCVGEAATFLLRILKVQGGPKQKILIEYTGNLKGAGTD